MSTAFPPANATRADIAAWQVKHDPGYRGCCARCRRPLADHLFGKGCEQWVDPAGVTVAEALAVPETGTDE
jgi:hypothetical protein